MRSKSFSKKNFTINLALILISLLLSLLLVEFFLRAFYPKYQYAAESKYNRSATRIWSRQPNTRDLRLHPDNGHRHLVCHNNLALRQHRDFSEADLKSAINIGFFGDSFTENLRLPAQYSFTEPLDYLLNLSQQDFNVLNLGVDGYGTDQAFLYYQELDYATDLDFVFYIFNSNDLRNIYENNLFSIDDSGTLIKNPGVASSWWVKVLSKLHVTYLGLDIWQRVFVPDDDEILGLEEYFAREDHSTRFHSQRAEVIPTDLIIGKNNEDLKQSIAIFQALLQLWKNSVEENGGKFYIVILPKREEMLAADLIIGEQYTTINLFELFSNTVDNYSYVNYSFKNDGHWNEASNLLVAVHLYRFLEGEAELVSLPEDKLVEELYTYYSAFPDGWFYYSAFPDEWVAEVWKTSSSVAAKDLGSIRRKYLALENQSCKTGN